MLLQAIGKTVAKEAVRFAADKASAAIAALSGSGAGSGARDDRVADPDYEPSSEGEDSPMLDSSDSEGREPSPIPSKKRYQREGEPDDVNNRPLKRQRAHTQQCDCVECRAPQPAAQVAPAPQAVGPAPVAAAQDNAQPVAPAPAVSGPAEEPDVCFVCYNEVVSDSHHIGECRQYGHRAHWKCADAWGAARKASGCRTWSCGLCKTEGPFPRMPKAAAVDAHRAAVYADIRRDLGRCRHRCEQLADKDAPLEDFEAKCVPGDLANFGGDLRAVRAASEKAWTKLRKDLPTLINRLERVEKNAAHVAKLQCLERQLAFDPDAPA